MGTADFCKARARVARRGMRGRATSRYSAAHAHSRPARHELQLPNGRKRLPGSLAALAGDHRAEECGKLVLAPQQRLVQCTLGQCVPPCRVHEAQRPEGDLGSPGATLPEQAREGAHHIRHMPLRDPPCRGRGGVKAGCKGCKCCAPLKTTRWHSPGQGRLDCDRHGSSGLGRGPHAPAWGFVRFLDNPHLPAVDTHQSACAWCQGWRRPAVPSLTGAERQRRAGLRTGATARPRGTPSTLRRHRTTGTAPRAPLTLSPAARCLFSAHLSRTSPPVGPPGCSTAPGTAAEQQTRAVLGSTRQTPPPRECPSAPGLP